jgi:hypothetical protein
MSPSQSTSDLHSPATPAATRHNDADDRRRIERRRLLEQLIPLRAQGKTFVECAAIIGGSAATLHRIEKAWREGGTDNLKTKHGNAGRKKLARVGPGGAFTADDVAFVKRLTIQTESLPLALERLSDSGVCAPEARELIDRYRAKGDYPPSFYQLFHVTAEEWAKAKGEKAFEGVTYAARRGMWLLDEEGRKVDLAAGDLVEADDVSVDVPYFVQLPDGSYRVGRQVLCFRDVASRKWIGAYAVSRPKDSYRGEDIARACREIVVSWGLVSRFRFERGSWESEPISGVKLVGTDGKETRWGGVSQLIPTQHVWKSNAKGGIEGGFRMLHKVLGLWGVRIGKTRGEYEEPTADMLAVNEGRKDPRTCGFIAWSELLGVLEKAFTLLNSRPVYFQELNEKHCPDDVWTRDMQARPRGALPACGEDLLWHFLPVKREVGASVAQAGKVKVTVAGYPLPFFFRIGGHNPAAQGEAFPFIERGHRLIVAFDPQRAAEGAVIFNAERGALNTQGWRPLQKLFVAPPDEEAPQVDLSGRAGQADNVVAAKVRNTQVRASFTAIGVYGQGARRVQQDHDGAGNVARVERGAAARVAPAEAPAPAPRAPVMPAPVRSRQPAAEQPRHPRTAPRAPAGDAGEDFIEVVSRRSVEPSRYEAPAEECESLDLRD